MKNHSLHPSHLEGLLMRKPSQQTAMEAQSQAAPTLDLTVTPAPEAYVETAWPESSLRECCHHVLSILLNELPRFAKQADSEVASRLRATGLVDALRRLDAVSLRMCFEEFVELALECARACGLLRSAAPNKSWYWKVAPYLRSGYELTADPMVAWHQLYRFWVGSPEFKERRRLCALSFERARCQIHDYVEQLFAMRASMLVIQLDLAYRGFWASRVSIEEAKADLRHFLVNLVEPGQPGAYVGNVWRVEDAGNDGYRLRLVLFLDDSLVHDGESHSQLLGEYWASSITNGRGSYRSYNTAALTHPRSGLGKIDQGDTVKRAELTRTLDDLTETFHLVPIRSGRTMGHGQVDQAPMVGPGRPRRPKADMLPDETGPAETAPLTYLPDVRDFEDPELEVSDI
jgi:hypothetical protein